MACACNFSIPIRWQCTVVRRYNLGLLAFGFARWGFRIGWERPHSGTVVALRLGWGPVWVWQFGDQLPLGP